MTPLELAITQRTAQGLEDVHDVDDSGISNVDIFDLFSRSLFMPGAPLHLIRRLFTPITERDLEILTLFTRGGLNATS
jgi:hypothetical protein